MHTALPGPLVSRPALPLSRHVAIAVVLLLASLAFLPCAPSLTVRAQGAILYVNSNATEGANTGQSWVDAYVDLQQALRAAKNGDEIWVAAGVYRPSVPAGRDATFALKPGVALYGGFVGTETAREQRNWTDHLTVMSGDVDRNDSTVQGITESYGDIVGSNVYHVVTADGSVTQVATIDGVVISGGKADAAPNTSGGGLYAAGASLIVRNTMIQGNYAADNGGGASFVSSTVTVVGSSILANASNGSGTYAGGGGLYFEQTTAQVASSKIGRNQAVRLGGGIHSVSCSPAYVNVLVWANAASVSGGGIAGRYSDYTLVNSTVTANHAASNGGGLYANNGKPVVYNSIVTGNTGQEFFLPSADTKVAYSIMPGWTSGIGNLDVDPLFDDSSTEPYHLSPGSPAIDRGSNDLVPTDVTTDLDGNARIFDGDGDGTAAVDMGAYEWPGHGLTVTTVGSGTVDIAPPGSHFVPGTLVTLTALPAPRWNFGGWSGDAEGSDSTVQVHMDATRVITATFLGPTAVTLGSFEAHSTPAGMLLQWETATESDMVGVLLTRRCPEDVSRVELNGGEMLPVLEPGQLMGHRYAYMDREAVPGRSCVYELEEVGIGSTQNGSDGLHTVEVFHWPHFWLLPMLGLPRSSAP